MTGILQSLLGSVSSAVAVVTDAYFNLVTLLLPGNGTNGAQNNTFLDSSTNNFTITRNGNTTQGTFSPFSQTGWSNFFNGSSYLQAGSNAALAPGSGNFTVEFWVFPTAGNTFYNALYQNYTDGVSRSTAFRISINNADATSLLVQTQASALITTSTGVLNTNAWNHVALVRNGSGSNNLVLYVNGVSVGTATNTTNFSDGFAQIGNTVYNAANYYWNGYISNFRVVPGTAVYTAAFTPPTSPLTAISGTALLTCQSNRFIDNSSNAFAITVNGTPSVQAFSPFLPTAAYDTAVVGGSGYQDASGDYLSCATNTSAFQLGAGDWCVEGWVYSISSSSSYLISGQTDQTTIGGSSFFIGYNGESCSTFSGGGRIDFTIGQLDKYAWTHLAFCRSGSTVSCFKNGTRVGTGTFSGTINNGSTTYPPKIGAGGSSTGTEQYISNVRIVKGSSPYNAASTTITVPTAPLTAITNTALLCNFTNAGITDATAKNDLETVGNAQISTTQSKFGGSSISLPDTSAYAVIQNYNNRFDFGTGDFTIECWLYITGALSGDQYAISFPAAGTSHVGINVFSSGWRIGGFNSYLITGSTGLSQNTWIHVAMVKYSGTLYAYINGALLGSIAANVSFSATGTVYFGRYSVSPSTGNNLTGYIDDLRITKYARYTTTFTPPTAAFPLS